MRRARALSLLAAVLAVAPAPATPTRAPVTPRSDPARDGAPIEIGRIHVLRSRILGDDRRLAVYLPQHYADPARRFPVVYLLDGGPREDFHHVTGLADISAAYGTTREVIVVGIEGVDRRHDLTSPSTDPGDLRAAPTSGGADAYRRFLLREVRPWVEARYRTDGRAALMGESLAGLFVVETLLREPAAFDDYVAVSPSLWWARQALSREAEADLRRGAFAGRRLFLADADERTYSPEMAGAIDRLVAALRTAAPSGLDWIYDPFPGETHATVYHPAAMAAIRRLYATPRDTPTP